MMENLKKDEQAILICTNDKPFPINDKGPDIKEGNEYKLNGRYTCNCGEIHYDVGLILNINFVECYKCRERLPPTTHWCHSSRFTLKQ